jgi:CheY-like chemotaxis protein
VADVSRLLSRVIGEGVQLKTHRTSELWPVRADSDQLGQVLINLAVNARDAMPRGGSLHLSTGNEVVDRARTLRGGELTPGRYATISVRDEGEGMSDEVLSRLFEPFFTTKEFGKGTGLGLATVYGIVRASGGAIDVQSRLGMGSTFTVYLPVTDDEPAGKARGQVAIEHGRGETILLVEDEDPVRMLVRRILVSHGYAVLEARDGADGLRRSKEYGGPIHLVITDVVMPEMTGGELAQQLVSERPGVRVLFMTGYTDHELSQADGASLLQKPFSSAALLGQVRKLLDNTAKS